MNTGFAVGREKHFGDSGPLQAGGHFDSPSIVWVLCLDFPGALPSQLPFCSQPVI